MNRKYRKGQFIGSLASSPLANLLFTNLDLREILNIINEMCSDYSLFSKLSPVVESDGGVCFCIYICVCVCVYIFVCVCVNICVCVSVCVNMAPVIFSTIYCDMGVLYSAPYTMMLECYIHHHIP